MIIGKDKLYLYEKDNGAFERVYIEGNPEYSYNINSSKSHIERLMDYLKNEYNMDTTAKIDFVIIDNEDTVISNVLKNILHDYTKEKYSVDDLMIKIFQKLKRDKKLLIPDYGINFDGKNYSVKNSVLEKKEFSLLGYTINQDELMGYIE
jgi:hypothetical protein